MKKDVDKKKITILLLVFIISGIIGFVYETFFYRVEYGYFVKRGTSFGPWIPIYGFGGLFMALITNKHKESPLKVFFLSLITAGTLEFLTGYYLFHVEHIRLWDYNTEMLNFGNIGGYICLRSILLFGISGIFLVKILIPYLEKLVNKLPFRLVYLASIVISFVCIIDYVTNIII